MQASASISVCIVCCNEADRLGECLDSVLWADEILLMDLESNDTSPDIAVSKGARVISHPPHPIVEPLRNKLAEYAKGNWILALDPDERVAPELAQLLQKVAQYPDIDAIVIPRMNYDLGYPPTHPIQRYEPQLRMYRPERVAWPNFPNKLPIVPDEKKFIVPQKDELVLVHQRNRNVPEIVERIMRYAPEQAQSMHKAGEEFSAINMLMALFKQVDKEFFRANAWIDGMPGIFRASILVIYKFYVWVALWQISGSMRSKSDDRLIQRLGMGAKFFWFFVKALLKLGSMFRR